MTVRSRLRALSHTHDYGLVLFLVVTTFVLLAAVPDGTALRLLAAGFGAATLVAVFVTGGVKPRVRTFMISVAVAAVLVAVLSHLGTEDTGKVGAGVASALLVLMASLGILRGIGMQPVVDRRTILGVISSYLLIGLFFAYLYEAVAAGVTPSFFSSGRTETISHFVYFSYVTMTTVGYGDFTAATDVGRTLAISEALLGQLYLVTVVALVVANIGRARKRAGSDTS